MSIFESLGNTPKRNPSFPANPMQTLQQLKGNPIGVLKQAGYNVPEGMNNPGQIINYLLQSGQITNPRLQMAQKMASGLFRR